MTKKFSYPTTPSLSRREFVPYIGLNWLRKYVNAADFAKSSGADIDDTLLMLGVRMWF